jgi:hypothetical protein
MLCLMQSTTRDLKMRNESRQNATAPFPLLGIHYSTEGEGADLEMPSFAGVVKIVSNVGSFVNGDNLVVAPTVSNKIYEGSGSGNVGDFRISSNFFSATAVVDSDLVDTGSNKVATGT